MLEIPGNYPISTKTISRNLSHSIAVNIMSGFVIDNLKKNFK